MVDKELSPEKSEHNLHKEQTDECLNKNADNPAPKE
jgi:hypothetical protein